MVSGRVGLLALGLGVLLVSPALASDAGYLYGRITTTDGDEFEGQIRWGKEEAFWEDIFNAGKVRNQHLDRLDRRTRNRIRWDRTGGLDFLFGDRHGFDHVFAARFGDLRSLEIGRGDEVLATFRNGEEMELEGGSNDIGARITVVDPTLGRQALDWKRIRRIEFRDTPERLPGKLGDPIYGTVKAGRYRFTGRIQWDNDECLSVDELDGETEDGKTSIRFGEIASIRKHRSGALVTLRSGSEIHLRGSNDVNSGNRGIVVVVPRVGSIKVGWDDFEEATFQRAPHSGRPYSEFARARDLYGTVVTAAGRRHEGQIVYDLDESWDFELLHGTNGATEYLIPFRDIARIRPQSRRWTEVELRNGLTVELGESQDVTRRNDGLLVFTGDEPAYIAWSDVREIRFR